MITQLDIYKPYLDQATDEGLRYSDENKSRYISFKICLEHLSKISNPNVLELGTCRSFVDGRYEGCNSDDPKYWQPNDISKWDWGAGCFSLIFGKTNCNLTTVDLVGSHIERCKIMTNSLGIKCQHVIANSIDFLNTTSKHYDLIYLDTGDMWPIKPTEQLQLEEVKIIIRNNLLNKGGLLLIDDVLNGTPREQGDTTNILGKSSLAIPYLSKMEFKIKYEGYQYIFSK